MASTIDTATAPDSTGLVFAASGDGTRSSSAAALRILAAALQPLDAAAADALRQEQRWRRNYPLHLHRLVEASLASDDAALRSARAGLDAAWSALRWHDGASDAGSLHDALAAPATRFASHTVRGEGEPTPAPWSVPLHGEQLTGERLLARLADWQRRGIIEAGAAQALARCAANPQWFDLSDRTLVLLGAGSEAGPLHWLMRWRARVVAVDLAHPAVWQRLERVARSGNGTLTAPLHAAGGNDGHTAHADTPGADLLRDAPALAAWLQALPAPLDIAALAYLDGERHVRVVMAMDMLMHAACAADARTTLAFLATPTDVFAVPRALADAAAAAYHARPALARTVQRALALAAGTRFFQPPAQPAGVPGYGVVDALVLQQGPNYALAKRLQQWRALQARAAGHRVSLNVAPSTTTSSVVKNPALAAGFAGADLFGVEVFAPATTNALMAALWVHDLRCDASPANPQRALAHPLELSMEQACHGGLWRCPYLPRSVLPFAAALGWWRNKAGHA